MVMAKQMRGKISQYLIFKDTHANRDARSAQDVDTGTTIAGMGIQYANKHTANTPFDQCLSTRGGPAMERAGLKGDKCDHLTKIATHLAQRHRFGVIITGRLGVAARNDGTMAHQNASNRWVRLTLRQGFSALPHGFPHHRVNIV